MRSGSILGIFFGRKLGEETALFCRGHFISCSHFHPQEKSNPVQEKVILSLEELKKQVSNMKEPKNNSIDQK